MAVLLLPSEKIERNAIMGKKDKNQKPVLKVYIVISLILMLSCFFSVPFINNAKDLKDEFLWSILHMKTVVFTLISLILNILIVVRWIFVFKEPI